MKKILISVVAVLTMVAGGFLVCKQPQYDSERFSKY